MAVWTRLDKLTSENAAHLKENMIALVLQYSDSQKKKLQTTKITLFGYSRWNMKPVRQQL